VRMLSRSVRSRFRAMKMVVGLLSGAGLRFG
jgi:hypothetical protein